MDARIAVVTGANRGLGLGTSLALAHLGYWILLTARNIDKARHAVKSIEATGKKIVAEELDVSSDQSVESFVRRLRDRFARVDVLVNNAGAIFESDRNLDSRRLPPTLITQALDTNAVGAYRTSRLLLPMMNEAGYGRIVNVSSGLGSLATMGADYPAYQISKAALNAVTRVFHAETVHNVKVNSVCPGWVRTEMGGKNAPRNLEEGVRGIVWAATLEADGPSGGFFRDGKPIDW